MTQGSICVWLVLRSILASHPALRSSELRRRLRLPPGRRELVPPADSRLCIERARACCSCLQIASQGEDPDQPQENAQSLPPSQPGVPKDCSSYSRCASCSASADTTRGFSSVSGPPCLRGNKDRKAPPGQGDSTQQVAPVRKQGVQADRVRSSLLEREEEEKTSDRRLQCSRMPACRCSLRLPSKRRSHAPSPFSKDSLT